MAAALLRIPARRVRALALGDDGALRDWIANESESRLAEARRDAKLAVERLEAIGARVISLASPEYPAGLRDLRDPPAFLCVRGTLRAHPWRAGTAIVGTRRPDPRARSFTTELSGGAAAPIVSGLALGIDAAAHRGALAADAATIAYVGHGFGATYPARHADLEDEIVARGGAIASELLPGEPVSSFSLVRRDRLQAAHAAAVVLVASESGGGARHALEAARRLGRPRFALEPQTAGAGYALNAAEIRSGAVPLAWNLASALRAIDAPHER